MKRSLQLNPDNRPATWTQIRDWREVHKVAPVSTTFGVIDADEMAENNMRGSLRQFSKLPTLDADGKLTWKRADNSFVLLSEADLTLLLEEMDEARTIRGAILHVKAEQFNMMDPKPLVKQIKDLSFWLT